MLITTIPEALEKIDELTGEVENLKTVKTEFDTYKAAMEEKMKTAMEETDEKKDEKKAMHKMKGMSKKFHAAMKAAMDETDEEKKKTKMEAAMKLYNSQEEEDTEEDKEKEKKEAEMTAELTILRKEVSKPRLQFLEASYKGRVPEDILKAYKASWEKMNITQLDGEVNKVKPFIKMQKSSSQLEGAKGEPLGFSTFTFPESFSAETKDEYSAKVEKMTPDEIFGGGS